MENMWYHLAEPAIFVLFGYIAHAVKVRAGMVRKIHQAAKHVPNTTRDANLERYTVDE
jgi:hypothetical protein